jgi:hypothetical protein
MRIFWKLAALPLALSLLIPAAASAQSSNISVFVNGQRMSFDQPPIMQSGRVFVPLRSIFQQLGASVVYNNGVINATGSGRTISLTIGSTTAVVNGQQQTLDVAPFTESDRTLVPLRFIAQALGAIVNWDDSSYAVTITSGRGGGAPPPRPPAPVGVSFVAKSPTGTIFTSQPLIGFQLSNSTRLNLIRVTLDGSTVPVGSINQLAAGSFNFRYPPLAPGRHTVRVWGKTNGGTPFDMSWAFNTAAAR